MHYRLEYSEEAKRALRTAPGYYRQLFKRTIEGLARDPRPANAEELREADYFKIKFGRWRVIYHIRAEDEAVRILRVAIKTGPETYQGLEDEEDPAAAQRAAAAHEAWKRDPSLGRPYSEVRAELAAEGLLDTEDAEDAADAAAARKEKGAVDFTEYAARREKK